MLKLFDENSEIANMFVQRTKDFTLVIDTLNLFLKQMNITKEVSMEVKEELGNDFDDREFTERCMKELAPRIKKIQKKLLKMEENGFSMMLLNALLVIKYLKIDVGGVKEFKF